jgi:hypothetical protein
MGHVVGAPYHERSIGGDAFPLGEHEDHVADHDTNIQEVQVQSVGASAEFGSMQGAFINVVTRQGGDTFSFDASYYGQTSGLTSHPVRLAFPGSGQRKSSFERVKYRDVATNLGGPLIRNKGTFLTSLDTPSECS